MLILARLILSLEKFIKNPVDWLSKQPWLFRFTLVILFIPLISFISITYYKVFFLDNNKVAHNNSCEQLNNEIIKLKQDLTKLHESQTEELIYLNENINLIKENPSVKNTEYDPVLGANDLIIENSEIEENLRQRLKNMTLNNTNIN